MRTIDMSVGFYVGFGLLLGLITAIYNSRAVYRVAKHYASGWTFLFWTAVTAFVAGITAGFLFHPITFAVLIAGFTFLLIINKDGKERAGAWYSQLILWTGMLAMSVAQTFNATKGPNLWCITFVLPVVAMIAGKARVKYLGEEDLGGHKTTVIAVLFVVAAFAVMAGVTIIAVLSASKQ